MVMTDESILEQAWASHDPHRAIIPSAVWRQLRAIKRELAPTAVVIENMLRDSDGARTVLGQVTRRRGMNRIRLLKELRRALPAASLRISQQEILEIFWLSPKPHIIVGGQGGEDQDCLLACYALAYPADAKGLTLHSGWALEISDHASARLLQRSAHADLRAAAQQAALAFVAADASIVRPLIGTATSIYLPVGSGCFAATVIGGMTQTGKAKIYARCRTFVPASWLKSDQQFLPRAADVQQTVALALWHWDRIGEVLPVLA
jgi:sarcosine oxidase gamma subunit